MSEKEEERGASRRNGETAKRREARRKIVYIHSVFSSIFVVYLLFIMNNGQ